MNYVDSNILIYALVDSTKKGEACRRLLDNEKLVTCVLSVDEVAYHLRKKSIDQALKAVDWLRNTPNLTLAAFLPEDLDAFLEGMRKGLYPRDAIHAACAKKVHAPIIYSEDSDFDKLPVTRKTPW